jgi:hypothetical protein
MTVLDNRKEALENKFMHDEELRFKATAFAIKKLANEIADKVGLSSDAAQALVTDVITNVLVVEGLKDALTFLHKKALSSQLTMTLSEVEVAYDHYFQSRMAELMGQKK